MSGDTGTVARLHLQGDPLGVAGGATTTPRHLMPPTLPTQSQPPTPVLPPQETPLLQPCHPPVAKSVLSKRPSLVLRQVMCKTGREVGTVMQQRQMSSPTRGLEPINGTSRSLTHLQLMRHQPHRCFTHADCSAHHFVGVMSIHKVCPDTMWVWYFHHGPALIVKMQARLACCWDSCMDRPCTVAM